MALIHSGILSGASGKVAGVVGGKWKGRYYLRARVTPANPKTVAQMAQRNKMSFLVNFGKPILDSVIKLFWDPQYKSISGWNAFIKTNLLNGSGATDPDLIQVSIGKLEGVNFQGINSYDPGDGSVLLNWDDQILSNGNNADIINAVFYDTDNLISIAATNLGTRVTGTASLNIGAGRVADHVVAYLFASQSAVAPVGLVSGSDSTVLVAP